MPPPLRPADFFDVKGLVERLVAPWIPAEEIVWKPAEIQAFTPRASAIAHTRAGEVLAVAGLLSESERERHGLDASVFAAEILVDALPWKAGPSSSSLLAAGDHRGSSSFPASGSVRG